MSLPKSYAQALFESAKEAQLDAGVWETIEKQLEAWVSLLKGSRELYAVLAGPISSTKEKEAIVFELARKMESHELLTKFLILVARKNRLGCLEQISSALTTVRLASQGVLRGNIISSEKLTTEDVAAVAQVFGKKLNHKVAFQTKVDADLLAGMKVTVGGVTYDGTLKTQLEKLRDQFIFGSA